jgi:hypothetical protein
LDILVLATTENMMFILRRFFHKAVAISESDTASDTKNLPLFEDSEKAKLVTGYVPSPPSKSWTQRWKLPFAIKLFFLIFAFVFTFFSGQSIKNYASLGYNALLRSGKAHDHAGCNQEIIADEPISVAAPPITASPIGATLLDRTGWAPTCSSSMNKAHDCSLAIDSQGDNTDWRSANVPSGAGHWIVIDLQKTYNVHSLAMRPSQGWKNNGGSVQKHLVEIATEKGNWDLVALGTWGDSGGGRHISTKYLAFMKAESADHYYRKICNV